MDILLKNLLLLVGISVLFGLIVPSCELHPIFSGVLIIFYFIFNTWANFASSTMMQEVKHTVRQIKQIISFMLVLSVLMLAVKSPSVAMQVPISLTQYAISHTFEKLLRANREKNKRNSRKNTVGHHE